MKLSAGILLYRIKEGQLQVFLVHPGGPFFKKKDMGWWTIPWFDLPATYRKINIMQRKPLMN